MDSQAFHSSSQVLYDHCNFGYYDYTNDNHFEQFFDLINIREENAEPTTNYDNEYLFNAALVDQNQFYPHPLDLFDLTSNTTTTTPTTISSDLKSVFNALPPISTTENLEAGREEDQNDIGDDHSSETTTTTTTAANTSTKRTKADRSKTLSAERKRRGRMKEKLYSLRSLVPNITKMDKASIVGDAVLYVQNLQMQAKKLQAEIAGVESSLKGETGSSSQRFVDNINPNKTQVVLEINMHRRIDKNIMKMDLFQVEEKGYYVRLESNNGKGVAVALYKALESITSLYIQSSNLSTAPERFVLTATINVRADSTGEDHQMINLPNMKLWISKALLNQGFEFIKSTSSSSSSIA